MRDLHLHRFIQALSGALTSQLESSGAEVRMPGCWNFNIFLAKKNGDFMGISIKCWFRDHGDLYNEYIHIYIYTYIHIYIYIIYMYIYICIYMMGIEWVISSGCDHDLTSRLEMMGIGLRATWSGLSWWSNKNMRCNWVYNGIESLQLVGGLKCCWMCGVFFIFDGFLAYLMVSFVMGVCIQVSFWFWKGALFGKPTFDTFEFSGGYESSNMVNWPNLYVEPCRTTNIVSVS